MQIIHSAKFQFGSKIAAKGAQLYKLPLLLSRHFHFRPAGDEKKIKYRFAFHNQKSFFAVLCAVESSANCKEIDKMWIVKECQEGPRGATLSRSFACLLREIFLSFISM